MKKVILFTAIGFALIGCVSQQYWVKSGTAVQGTAADLEACRLAANNGGQKVYTAQELEQPCMVAKGYHLSDTPPPG